MTWTEGRAALLLGVAIVLQASLSYATLIESPREQFEDQIEEWRESVNMPNLTEVDQAILFIQTTPTFPPIFNPFMFLLRHSECYECPLIPQIPLVDQPPSPANGYILQTKFYSEIAIASEEDLNTTFCRGDITVKHKGEYWLIVTRNQGELECHFIQWNDPPNPHLVLLWAFLVYLGIAIVYVCLKILYNKGMFTNLKFLPPPKEPQVGEIDDVTSTAALVTDNVIYGQYTTKSDDGISTIDGKPNLAYVPVKSPLPEDEEAGTSPSVDDNIYAGVQDELETTEEPKEQPVMPRSVSEMPATSESSSNAPMPEKYKFPRLKSLDAFRGCFMIWMIYIHYGQKQNFWFFQYAHWDGFTLADLCAPMFVFIMGISMGLSFNNMTENKNTGLQIFWKITWRSIKLFGLGIILNTKDNNDISAVRVTGVLQRLALTYWLTAMIHFPFNRMIANGKHRLYTFGFSWCNGGFKDLLWYWPEWIIQLGFVAAHMSVMFAWHVPNCPEQWVGPGGLHWWGYAFFCTGGAAGYIDRYLLPDNMYTESSIMWLYNTIQNFDPEGFLSVLILTYHCFLGLQVGKVLVHYPEHDRRVLHMLTWAIYIIMWGVYSRFVSEVPVNRNLWSVTYMYGTVAVAFFIIGIFYWLIDWKKYWSGAPFIYPGKNGILIYACMIIFGGYFPVSWAVSDPTSHAQWQVVFMWGATFWTIIAFILHRKKIYVTL